MVFVLFVCFASIGIISRNAVTIIQNYNTDIFPAFTPSPPISKYCRSLRRIPWRRRSILIFMTVQDGHLHIYLRVHSQLLKRMKDYKPNSFLPINQWQTNLAYPTDSPAAKGTSAQLSQFCRSATSKQPCSSSRLWGWRSAAGSGLAKLD